MAEKTGISASTLRELEYGNSQIQMTRDRALKIGLALGVNPQSILDGGPPLDVCGRPFVKSRKGDYFLSLLPSFRETRKQLFEALLDAATEKKIGTLIAFDFETWIMEACQKFGLDISKKLTERLGLFDPWEIPLALRPKDKRLAKQWASVEQEIENEQVSLIENSPNDYPKPDNDDQMLALITALREEALENIRERKASEKPPPRQFTQMEDIERTMLFQKLIARIDKNLGLKRPPEKLDCPSRAVGNQ